MVGYAESREDLAFTEVIPALRTGDIAHFDARGLFYIDGRTSRFVKPYGIRVSAGRYRTIAQALVSGGRRHRNRRPGSWSASARPLPKGRRWWPAFRRSWPSPPAVFVIVENRAVPRLARRQDRLQGAPRRPCRARRAAQPATGLSTGIRRGDPDRAARENPPRCSRPTGAGFWDPPPCVAGSRTVDLSRVRAAIPLSYMQVLLSPSNGNSFARCPRAGTR